jgi:IS1 family transposase
MVRHSFLRTRRGRLQRWRCKICRRTCTARSGTPYHRLRNPASRFDVVVRMVMEGSSKASIARVHELSVATVERWVGRAAQHASTFSDRLVQGLQPVEIQADELRGWGPSRKDRHYVFAVIEVWSRLWVSQRVGGRTMRNCRLVMQDARSRCSLSASRTLIVTDPFRYYREAIIKAWGRTCVHVESKKCIRNKRVVAVKNKLVWGTDWQLEAARERSEDSKKLNTAYIERLNLFVRRSLVCLHRRSTSLVRSAENLGSLVGLLQCFYNFVRPHGSMRFGLET